MLVEVIGSALANAVVLFGVPLLIYSFYHKKRHGRSFGEVTERAGVRVGEVRYIGYCALLAVGIVGYVILRPPDVEALTREGSAMRPFMGLGLGGASVFMALMYGIVKTGFCEEFLFRGLIAGSLSRRLPILWANIIQALIFLLPHLLVLGYAPEMWPILPVVFAGALFGGWIRIKSGSFFGPWLLHAAANVTTCLLVAANSAG